MPSDSSPSPGLSPDDALPPVEPPSAGFILQLFIVPGVIVVVVVTVWLMFSWLAQKGNDRDAFVKALARNNEARWQAAFNLANALRAERGSNHPQLTADPQLAKQLADILDREIEAGSMDEKPITLRIFLSRALGEFRIDEGLPTLIKAAKTQRDDKERDVRRAAIEGIAVLVAGFDPDDKRFIDNAQLSEVLVDAAQDSDPRTRSAAAVALGVIGGPHREKLRAMLTDAYPDVRYNAAIRLALFGDVEAAPVLAEMIDSKELAGVEAEKQEDMQPFKRALITVNALRAIEQLAEKNSDADLSELKKAVESVLAADPAIEIRVPATSALRVLSARAAQPVK